MNSGSDRDSINSITGDNGVFVVGLNSGWASISRDIGETWKELPRGLNSGANQSILALALIDKVFISGLANGWASISSFP